MYFMLGQTAMYLKGINFESLSETGHAKSCAHAISLSSNGTLEHVNIPSSYFHLY